jgi:amidohydrolase
VITFGKLESGTAFNIIAGKSVLEGTVWSFTAEVRKTLQKKLEELTTGLAKIYGATIKLDYQRGYSAVENHKREADIILAVAKEVFGGENIGMMRPNMVWEDFAYYLKEIPGAFCFVGAGDPNKPMFPHHHPRFQIDESVLPIAAQWFCQLAIKYLKS